ncbi:MAG: DUF4405 domain-containing protein [Candidatus Woesearchaeota archaeon]
MAKKNKEVREDGCEEVCKTMQNDLEGRLERETHSKWTPMDSKMLVDLSLLISLGVAVGTGIFYPHVGYQGGRNAAYFASQWIRDAHAISSYIAAGLGIVHLVQHYELIKCYLKGLGKRMFEK